jgi:hypothetical protein
METVPTPKTNNNNIQQGVKNLPESRHRLAELYYAFNIEEKKKRGIPSQKINFENINRNFYDDLIEHDDVLRKSKHDLKINKSNGIKELIYSNKRIPEIWSQKISYYDDLYNTMSEDRNFVAYLGRGNEHESLSKQQENETQQHKAWKSKFHITKNNNIHSHESSTLTSANHSRPLSPGKLKGRNNPYGRFVNMITDYKEINNLLEEYRQNYPLELPSKNKYKVLLTEVEETKMKLPTITKYNEHINKTHSNMNTIMSQESNKGDDDLTKRSIKTNSNTNTNNNTHNNNTHSRTHTSNKFDIIQGINKSKFFRTTMYSQLIPESVNRTQRGRHNTEVSNLSNHNDVFKHHNKNGFETNYLNVSHEEFVKLKPIYNPKIKEKLETINNYGPHYSHCPPCRNKNTDFYNKMETNQCLKLLNYLHSVRKKD